MWATNPTPHASCSLAGSYKPCAAGLIAWASTALADVVIVLILLFIKCLDYGANNGTNNDGTSNIGEYPGECNPFLTTLSLLIRTEIKGTLFNGDRVKFVSNSLSFVALF
jgi:hypothetical protein